MNGVEWQAWAERIVDWLGTTTWQASLLAALVVLVQWAFRGILAARWRYLLWFVVLGRLILPALPESPVSLYRYVPPLPPLEAAAHAVPPSRPGTVAANREVRIEPPPLLSWKSAALLAWGLGALGLAGMLAIRNAGFHRRIRRNGRLVDQPIQETANAIAVEFGQKRMILVFETADVTTPGVIGLLSPLILLPEGSVARLSGEDLRMIFRHEMAHLQRGDLAVNFLSTLLQIVHWFNPVLWWAFGRMRDDRELATDALALAAEGNSREAYGTTLLKLAADNPGRLSLSPLIGILPGKGQIEERIEQISRLKPKAYAFSLVGIGLLIGLALVALTKPHAHVDANWIHPGMPIRTISLLDLPVIEYKVGYGDLWISKTLEDRPVWLGQKPCENYLFAVPMSHIVYHIPPGAVRFNAVGVRPSGEANIAGSWAYIVKIDGQELFHSKALSDYPNFECPIEVAIPAGAKQLELIGDNLRNTYFDHAVWAEPTLEGRFLPADIPHPTLPRSPIPLSP